MVKGRERTRELGRLLAVDAGNTNTVFGVWEDDRLVLSLRLSTALERTSDEYGATLQVLLERAGIAASTIEATRLLISVCSRLLRMGEK